MAAGRAEEMQQAVSAFSPRNDGEAKRFPPWMEKARKAISRACTSLASLRFARRDRCAECPMSHTSALIGWGCGGCRGRYRRNKETAS